MRVTLLGLLAAGVAVGCQVGAGPKASPATARSTPPTAGKAVAPELAGRWVEARVEAMGMEAVAGDTWEISDGSLAILADGRAIKMAYRVDKAEKPYKIDLGRSGGAGFEARMLGIFEVEGGVLTLCLGDGEARPKDFSSAKGNFTTLVRLTPEKPPADAKPTTPATKK